MQIALAWSARPTAGGKPFRLLIMTLLATIWGLRLLGCKQNSIFLKVKQVYLHQLSSTYAGV
jgi:steroid 5-alpha reductase family enzyme